MLDHSPLFADRIRAFLSFLLAPVSLRPALLRLLLSLLLLVSQQIGMTHGYTHLRPAGDSSVQPGQDNGKGNKRLADLSCDDCLSIAQIAVAIGSPILTAAASPFTFGPVATPATLASCLRTTCVFQPRAPPQA